MARRKVLFLAVLLMVLAFGCWLPVGNAAQVTPAVVALTTAVIPTEALSIEPSLTPSPLPSDTPLPTATTVPTLTPTAEPAGCWRPPDDYSRVEVNNGVGVLNRRTLAMLEHAAQLYGGEIEITGYSITQGSYTSSEPASFGTHDGGGAVDLSVMRPGTWTVLYDELEPLIHALRISGFAAWVRDFNELYSGSPIHIHAVAIGDQDLSIAAREQLNGTFGYFRGFTGVPLDGPPALDRHGGPILCQWMIDMGYQDLRNSP